MSCKVLGEASFLNSELGVILPTYNEADTIGQLIEDIENLNLNATILIIDDSSPDGTLGIAQQKQEKYENVLLYTRAQKRGLGTAITDGFKFFLNAQFIPKYIITMDADYSHNPQDIPRFLSTIKECNSGIVIGSRYINTGRIAGWPISRKILSKTANYTARVALGLKLKDCTSGYRCYSTNFLKEAITNLHSHTYEIQIETIRQAALRNFLVTELPILFVNRKRGKSKLSWNEIKSFLTYTIKTVWCS